MICYRCTRLLPKSLCTAPLQLCHTCQASDYDLMCRINGAWAIEQHAREPRSFWQVRAEVIEKFDREIASAERPKASAATGEICDVTGSMGAREVRK